MLSLSCVLWSNIQRIRGSVVGMSGAAQLHVPCKHIAFGKKVVASSHVYGFHAGQEGSPHCGKRASCISAINNFIAGY